MIQTLENNQWSTKPKFFNGAGGGAGTPGSDTDIPQEERDRLAALDKIRRDAETAAREQAILDELAEQERLKALAAGAGSNTKFIIGITIGSILVIAGGIAIYKRFKN